MVDAHGLGPCSVRSGGSSPLPPTGSEISLVVELVLPKHRAPVRFRHLALFSFTQLIKSLPISLAIIDFESDVGD